MKIKINKKTFVNNFLAPISRVTERCVLSVFPDHLQSLVSLEGNPILYAYVKTTTDIGKAKEVTLNIANVSKLTRMLNCIDSDEVELDVNSNNLEYNSLNMRFKYHLLEDGVISKTLATQEKIQSLTFDSDFVLSKEKSADIMKGTSFASETNKLYFYMKDDKVHAELTDKQVANIDSVAYFVTDTFNGTEIKNQLPIKLEWFKMFYGNKEDCTVKVNTKAGLMMFKFENSDYTLQYIIAPLVK